ncbi:MAG: DUF3311 domain-containing protein [Gemmatimonadaceae bacterium]
MPTRTAEDPTVPDAARPTGFRPYHWLTALPTVILLGGIPFVNRVHPLLFGMPLLMAWIVIWVVVTSGVMGLVLYLDRTRERNGR